MAQDPNKYRKNADIKPDTLMRTLISAGSMILMLIGIVGLALELFKENGWIGSALSWLFDSTSHMMFIPVIALVAWVLNRIISAPSKDEMKKSGNLPMYLMMGAGAYYVFRVITTGGF